MVEFMDRVFTHMAGDNYRGRFRPLLLLSSLLTVLRLSNAIYSLCLLILHKRPWPQLSSVRDGIPKCSGSQFVFHLSFRGKPKHHQVNFGNNLEACKGWGETLMDFPIG